MGSLDIAKINTILEKNNLSLADYQCFIETGTHLGKTCINLSSFFKSIHTIEISKKYFEISKNSLKQYSNIVQYLGDSSYLLIQILEKINQNCIFWLDGHWSGGDTGKGNLECPLLQECKIIDEFILKKDNKAVVIIDDYRLFGENKNHDWSQITVKNINAKFTCKVSNSNIDIENDNYQLLLNI